MQPFPYQQKAVNDCLNAWVLEGINAQVFSMATGSGKTFTAGVLAHTVLEEEDRCLFLAHRDQLLTQAYEEFKAFFPEKRMGIVQGHHDTYRADIVFGSQMTLARPERLKRILLKGGFKIVFIDEAHRVRSETYEEILKQVLGDDTLLVGLTATPVRADGRSLAKIFQEVTVSVGILELIAHDPPHLCDLKRVTVETDLDLSLVETSEDGDFNGAHLDKAIERSQNRYQVAIEAIQRYAPHHQGIFFAANKHDARAFTKYAMEADITCATVTGETKEKDREEIYERYRQGEYQYLSNVFVLTEGSNFPVARVGIIGRHTKSQGLYIQMIGRLTRVLPTDRGKPYEEWEKPSALVIDLADNQHKVIMLPDLLGTTEERMGKKSIRQLIQDKEIKVEKPPEPAKLVPHPVSLAMSANSVFTEMEWIPYGGKHFKLNLPGVGTTFAEFDLTGYNVTYVGDNGVTRHVSEHPIRGAELAFGIGEQYLMTQQRTQQHRDAQRHDPIERARRATPDQIAKLKAAKLPAYSGMTAGEVRDLWDQLTAARKQGKSWWASEHGKAWNAQHGRKPAGTRKPLASGRKRTSVASMVETASDK